MRAYLLFAEAAARDPQNTSYRANRDALSPAAKLLTQASVESADIAKDVESAQNEAAHPEPPIQRISQSDWQNSPTGLPHVQANSGQLDFDLHANAKSLVEMVGARYGVRVLVDPEIDSAKPIHFEGAGR